MLVSQADPDLRISVPSAERLAEYFQHYLLELAAAVAPGDEAVRDSIHSRFSEEFESALSNTLDADIRLTVDDEPIDDPQEGLRVTLEAEQVMIMPLRFDFPGEGEFLVALQVDHESLPFAEDAPSGDVDPVEFTNFLHCCVGGDSIEVS